MQKQLSPLYWLYLPVAAMVVQIILELSIPSELLSALHSENGPHELLEFFLLTMGLFSCFYYFFKIKEKTKLWNFWFGLAALCCFYVAGEEISWGQHIIDWATPEYWGAVNDQNETNLHNTSSWFDQKPRLILELCIVIGTLIVPLLLKKKIFSLPESLEFLLPSQKLSVIALLILVPKIIEKTFEAFDTVVFTRFSEVHELYMFYFVLLYLIMLIMKIQNSEKT